MLHTRSLFLMACMTALTGCGARTIADDYRFDSGVVSPDVPLPDVPLPDVPLPPDVILPDVPPPPDVTPVCDPGRALCGRVCVDVRNDPMNCGRCGQLCAGPGSMCSNGVCSVTACVDGFSLCSGTCVDLQNDAANCGRCGQSCGASDVACSLGVCIGVLCSGGLSFCGRACVDLRSDPLNCGVCGRACPPDSACMGGACTTDACPVPTTRCGGVCVNVSSDPMNCGACGRPCRAGQRCDAGACSMMSVTGTPFQITALTSANCRAVEHNTVTGDDRGGIAIGSGVVFYTGDDRTASFDLDTLMPAARGTQPLDGIFGVTSPGLAFTLGSNRTPLEQRTSIIDTVIGVSPMVTLNPMVLPLSAPIFLDRAMLPDDVGIHGGVDRMIITAGSRAWIIEGTSATVTPFAIAPIAEHQRCESWAHWGVAEFLEGAPWVAYVRDSRSIVRQNLLTGEVRTIAVFDNLSDMCSFTVLPGRGRWYFHHEGASQFRMGDETLGFCDARFSR